MKSLIEISNAKRKRKSISKKIRRKIVLMNRKDEIGLNKKDLLQTYFLAKMKLSANSSISNLQTRG